MQLKQVRWAVLSPPFRGFLSTPQAESFHHSVCGSVSSLHWFYRSQRRGRDTAPYPTRRQPTARFRLGEPPLERSALNYCGLQLLLGLIQ